MDMSNATQVVSHHIYKPVKLVVSVLYFSHADCSQKSKYIIK